jgi:hypothetical protein
VGSWSRTSPSSAKIGPQPETADQLQGTYFGSPYANRSVVPVGLAARFALSFFVDGVTVVETPFLIANLRREIRRRELVSPPLSWLRRLSLQVNAVAAVEKGVGHLDPGRCIDLFRNADVGQPELTGGGDGETGLW